MSVRQGGLLPDRGAYEGLARGEEEEDGAEGFEGIPCAEDACFEDEGQGERKREGGRGSTGGRAIENS